MSLSLAEKQRLNDYLEERLSMYLKLFAAVVLFFVTAGGLSIKAIVENAANSEIKKQTAKIDEVIAKANTAGAQLEVKGEETKQKISLVDTQAAQLIEKSNSLQELIDSSSQVLDAANLLEEQKDEIANTVIGRTDLLQRIEQNIRQRLAFVPRGAILLWATKQSIPSGWAICDGSNGTPNLSDKFIMGAKDLADSLIEGGSVSHQHSGSTTGTAPGHKGDNANDRDMVHPHHVHGFTTNAVSHLPPYIKMVYIMKVQ